MNTDIALWLLQDGVTSGAFYALLALALVLEFAVTRVIYIPQGEYVALGALTVASLQAGKTPGTVWLLIGFGAAVVVVELAIALKSGRWRAAWRAAGWNLAYPLAAALVVMTLDVQTLPLAAQVALALVLVVPLGPMIYRLAFQPIAHASVLVLLIVSVAVHFVLVGLALLFLVGSALVAQPFTDARFELGAITLNGQALWVIAASCVLIVVLYVFFERTIYGKALRATAMNRTGARLMGISTVLAGKQSFALAAFIGALSGLLIGPTTTLGYDSGFLIGLKGFVAAIFGGLASYPATAIGALFVGLIESFGSFYASALKEVIVFTLIIPVLLWRSFQHVHDDEEE